MESTQSTSGSGARNPAGAERPVEAHGSQGHSAQVNQNHGNQNHGNQNQAGQNQAGQNQAGQNQAGQNQGQQNQAQRLAGQAGEGLGHAASEVQNIGVELIGAVREGATSLFDEQRKRAADEIAAVGDAIRKSVQSLDSSGGVLTRYADEAATQISGFAESLRDRPWDALAADIEDFARRWPMVFVASAVGIGFVAGRFLVSSASRPADRSTSQSRGQSSSSQSRADQREAGAEHGSKREEHSAAAGGATQREKR